MTSPGPEIIIKMSYSLLEVVYWVVKRRTLSSEKIQTWHYYNDYFVDDDEVIEWHDGEDHPKRRAKKTQIKKELSPLFGIHQDIGISVCQKMKKGIQKHCGHKHSLFCVW